MPDYRAKDTLIAFAKIAAEEYLGKNQTGLNTTLKKIASEESLTPFQIEFVAAEANKAVWGKLFSLDKQASYDFPLANAEQVLKDLQITHTPKVVKGADLDYLSPPTSSKLASFDPFKALGVIPDALEKSASARKEIKRQLEQKLVKMAAAKEELELQLYVVGTKIENLETDFVKTARQMVLEYSFADRPAALEKMAEFLRGCENHKYATVLMAKLAHVLKRQGLVKEADLKAPEQYISDKLPARIINGVHSLYATVKTIFENYDWRNDLRSRYEIVDSSLPVVREKIREL